MSTPRPINVADHEQLAEACCEPGYWGYVVGGAGDETTLRDNLEAFRRRILRPRMLVDVSGVSTRTTVLVVEAMGGRAEVNLDGGVRRGTDAVKTLALGARSVLAGRPALWGLAAAGEDGARDVLELLGAGIRLAPLLLGCPRPGDVGPQHVAARG